MNEEDIINYWIIGSEEALTTAEELFKVKKYSWTLFFCQLTLEKLLKAIAYSKRKDTPITHDLMKLVDYCTIEVTQNQKENLNEITTFNLESRYDDYKFSFYKKATQEYTNKWLSITKEYTAWLKKNI